MVLKALFLAALWQPGMTDVLVENALHISTPQGEYVTYFNADGSYTTTIGVSGQWWVENGELCVQRSTGEGGCSPIQDGLQVGSTWQAENPTTGAVVTYTIVPAE